MQRAKLLIALLLVACGGATPAARGGGGKSGAGGAAPGPVSSAVAAAPAAPAAPAVPSLVITNDSVVLNGVPLPAKPTPEDVYRILGRPDRTEQMANLIHVYDQLGIILYQGHGELTIKDLSVLYAVWDWQFMPRRLYPGTLTLKGVPIDGMSTIADLRARVPLVDDSGWYTTRVLGEDLFVTPAERDSRYVGKVSITFPTP